MSETFNNPAAGERKINSPRSEFWRRFKKNRIAMASLIMLAVLTVMALAAPLVTPYDPYRGELPDALKSPGLGHVLGTDELGRDIYTRIIYGARVSLKVGLLAVAVALGLGTLLGTLAAYYGRWVDNLIMKFMNIMLAIPSLLLAIAFITVLGRGIENAIIAIGIVSAPEYARIVRGSVLSVKEKDYVQAARAIGNGDMAIITRHILPNVTAPIIVRATLGISTAILETAALGFLGLVVQTPFAEWGTMLGAGRNYLFNAPHMVYFPGLAITITVLAFNLLGYGLRDALDPGMRRQGGEAL